MKPNLLTRKQSRSLLQEFDGRLDRELTSIWSGEGGSWEVYRLKDERVVALHKFSRSARAQLYPTPEALIQVAREIAHFTESYGRDAEGNILPRHVLYGRCPLDEQFPERISALSGLLPQQLGVNQSSLDYSLRSLLPIQRACRKRGYQICLDSEVLCSLLAYVSEVMRRAAGGRIVVTYNDQDEVWVPSIQGSDGRSHDPVIPVYDTLSEQLPLGSLKADVAGRLGLSDLD
jgi:hypothetical protein